MARTDVNDKTKLKTPKSETLKVRVSTMLTKSNNGILKKYIPDTPTKFCIILIFRDCFKV